MSLPLPSTDPATEAFLAEVAQHIAAYKAAGGKVQSVPYGVTKIKPQDMQEIQDSTWRARSEREAEGRKRGGFQPGHTHNRAAG